MRALTPATLLVLALAMLSRALPPQLTIDRGCIFAAGEFDVIYNIDICTDNTLTNWTFGTNIVGNGTNSPPEWIDVITTNGNKFYRIHLE